MPSVCNSRPEKPMQSLDTIHDYLRSHSDEIGERILSSYPALHGADERPSPLLSRMVRAPYPAQTLAIMGVSKRWQLARNANVVAECGAGKTLIALGSMLVHSAGRPFSGLVMAGRERRRPTRSDRCPHPTWQGSHCFRLSKAFRADEESVFRTKPGGTSWL